MHVRASGSTQCLSQDSEIMGHFDPLSAKTRVHFPIKGANKNLLVTCTQLGLIHARLILGMFFNIY